MTKRQSPIDFTDIPAIDDADLAKLNTCPEAQERASQAIWAAAAEITRRRLSLGVVPNNGPKLPGVKAVKRIVAPKGRPED